MAGRNTPNNWMLTIGIDPRDALRHLKEYRLHLNSMASSLTDRRSTKWLKAEAKRVTVVMKSIRNRKHGGVISDSLEPVGQSLYTNVLATWRGEMQPHTYRYLNSISKSPVYVDNNVIYVSVGNWPRMMKATSFDDRAQQTPWESWVKPKRGPGSQFERSIDKNSAFRGDDNDDDSGTSGKTYIASDGPLAGMPITGYWYFQEQGFHHHWSGRWIHHPVFSSQNMDKFQQQSINIFKRKIHILLKRTGRYPKWGGR